MNNEDRQIVFDPEAERLLKEFETLIEKLEEKKKIIKERE